MADKLRVDTVYAVAWPSNEIVKVGYTYIQRWRTFVARGGTLLLHEQFGTSTEAFAREGSLHSLLSSNAPRAFQTRDEARPFLGASGSGWLECYLINLETLKEVTGIG